MIDIKGIKKSFGSLQVLKGIDLHIDKGEIVSIVGPSGAGKTTLLQIIGTLDKPDSGTIKVDGVDVSSLSSAKLTSQIAAPSKWTALMFRRSLLPSCPTSATSISALCFSSINCFLSSRPSKT